MWKEPIRRMKKYSLKKDHEAIKKQIKEWETKLDILITYLETETSFKRKIDIPVVADGLANISNEMMAINI